MATTLANFAIDNPLLALQSAPQGGGTPAPGSVTGGPGGSIANNTITNTNIALGTVTGGPGGNIANSTITNANIVPGTITGGPGGNIATGTITGGPGGNIAPGTITSTELAPGAAAANINAGPAGAINSSQIAGGPFVSASTHAGNTQFGLVEFDPSGDLTETAANSGIALLKPGAAASNINAGPAGSINSSQISGGPFLSLSGGTMSGAIIQPVAPVANFDLANKLYVDSLSGPKACSKWYMTAQQNVSAVIPSYTSLVFGAQETPVNPTSPSATLSIDGTNTIISVTSTSTNQTAFRIDFHCETFANFANPLDACNGIYTFFDTTASATFGTKATTYFIGQNNLNTPLSSVTTPCTLQSFVILSASSTFTFSVQVGIVGTTTAAVGEAPSTQAVEPYVSVQQIY